MEWTPPTAQVRFELYNNNDASYQVLNVDPTWKNKILYGRLTIDSTGAYAWVYDNPGRTNLIPTQDNPWPLHPSGTSNLSYRYLYALDCDTRSNTSGNNQSVYVANIDIQEDTGYIAQNGGTVLRTTSGGAGWEPDVADSTNLQDTYFVTPDLGWAVGDSGTIRKTIDGGGVWTDQSTGASNLQSVYFSDANNGCTVGSGGTVLWTNNGGTLWTPASSGVPAENINSVYFITSSYGWAVGDNGTIIITADGGDSWAPQTSPVSENLYGVYFVDANNGWAVGANDTILVTSDGGNNWTTQTSPSSGVTLADIHMVDGLTGYISGTGGTILRTTTGGGKPVGGYTADNVIPAAQVIQATDGSGNLTLSWKGRDDEGDNVTLYSFQYSDDGGATWYTPTNGDTSLALSADWNDNVGGVGWTTAASFAAATDHSFTFNTRHTDLSGQPLDGTEQNDIQVRFFLNDGGYNSIYPVTSENFSLDNLAPTNTFSDATYDEATDTLTITGTNFTSIAAVLTDIKAYVDWSKFVWDVNGDDAITPNITFDGTGVSSLTITNDTTLTLIFTVAKASSIESTIDYGSSGGADTIDVTTGFSRDAFGNAATTDALNNAPLTINAITIQSFHPRGHDLSGGLWTPLPGGDCLIGFEWQCVNDQSGNVAVGTPEQDDGTGSWLFDNTDGGFAFFSLDLSTIPAGSTITDVDIYAMVGEISGGPAIDATIGYRVDGGAPVWGTLVQIVGGGCSPAPAGCNQQLNELFTGLTIDSASTLEIGFLRVSSGTKNLQVSQIYATLTWISGAPPATYDISGRVFEDSDFNGTASNWSGDAGDLGLQNVDVELYDNSDVYQSSTTTDANGDFAFIGLTDLTTYKIRVRSATIGDDPGGPNETAPMGGFNGCVAGATCAAPLPEMTWGYSSAMIGGQTTGTAASADDTQTLDNAGPGDTWVSVSISGANVSNVNFGFAYNLITNTGDDTNNLTTRSKQGSIRQFIKNSNAIGAAGGTTANYSQFMIPNTDPNMQTAGGDNWFRIIQAAAALPNISDGGTVIDGRTQATNVPGNVNSQGPEIELDGSGAGAVNGFNISNVANVTIRDLVINNFGGDGIQVLGAGTTGTVIYGNYIGTDATGEIATPNTIGIRLTASANNVNIGGVNAGEGNLISGNSENSIVVSNSDTVTIRGNIIGTDKDVANAVPNGSGTPAVGNISVAASTNITIGDATSGNVISGNVDQGIQVSGASDNIYIQNNRIGTGLAGTENLPNSNGGISIVPTSPMTNMVIGGTTSGLGNIIAYNGNFGINVSKVNASILLNEIRDNATNGINVPSGGSGSSTWIYHNTVTGNGSNGVYIDDTGVVMKNNILAGNILFGYDTTQPFEGGYNFVTDDFNAPINGSGCCNGQGIDGTYITTTPVNFTNYASKDFTLNCSVPSAAIDAGCDYGAAGDDTACDTASDIAQLDVNGATAGNYNYTAPDIGAFESSCAPVTYSISGRVFEDSDFNGIASNWTGDAGDLGLQNIDVELYDNSDVYQSSTTTDANGDFTFSGLSDLATYKVRVRSATIGDDPGGPNETAPMGGFNGCVAGATCAAPLPEMTWGYSSAMVGGQTTGTAASADDTQTLDNSGPGDTWVSVSISGADVTNVNFGFAYNLITNTVDDANGVTVQSRQGSLRQFIKNADAIGSAGGTTANSSRFNITTAPNDNDGGSNEWHRITLQQGIDLVDSGTTIDATTQTALLDSNSSGPEVVLDGSGPGLTTINIDNSGSHTIKGLGIYGYSVSAVRIQNAGATNIQILGNYLGTDAIGMNDGFAGGQYAVLVQGGASLITVGNAAEGNLISGNNDASFGNAIIIQNSNSCTIQGNYIGTNRFGSAAVPNCGNNNIAAVEIQGTSANTVIGGAGAGEGNVISGNNCNGLSIADTASNTTVYGNTIGEGPAGEILGNARSGISIVLSGGVGGYSIGGLASGQGNIIANNGPSLQGAGIRYTNDASSGSPTIQGNSIYGNGYDGIYVVNTTSLSSLTIAKNLLTNNGSVSARSGIYLGGNAANVKIYQNTIHASQVDGVQLNAATAEATIRNNIITGSATGYGINVVSGTITLEGNNDITDSVTSPPNTLGRSTTGLDASDMNVDPDYSNIITGDLTLKCTSSVIDQGADLLLEQPDMNGATAGLWNGSAPDMGAFETDCGPTLALVKQAWEAGATSPLSSPLEAPSGSTITFLIYIKNTTASQVNDIRFLDNLDDSFFDYVEGSLWIDDGSLADTATDLEIFNATAPGTGTNVSDLVDANVASACDVSEGVCPGTSVDRITAGAVAGQANGTLNINANTTFAVRYEVIIK